MKPSVSQSVTQQKNKWRGFQTMNKSWKHQYLPVNRMQWLIDFTVCEWTVPSNPWNVSSTWSCLKLLPPGLGSAEQERWRSRVPKTSTVLTVMAIVFCSQFGQCQRFSTILVVSQFVARQFWPELKFTEDGQELIWNRTSEQEGRSLSTACFSLVSSFYHERVWAARVRWIIWNPETPWRKSTATHLTAAWRKSTWPYVLHRNYINNNIALNFKLDWRHNILLSIRKRQRKIST